MRNIEAKVEVEECKRIGRESTKGGEMVWVKLGKEKQKREVMSKRRNLRDKRVRIFED